MSKTFSPGDVTLTIVFKEDCRNHRMLSDRRWDAEGGRNKKSGGIKVARNCPEHVLPAEVERPRNALATGLGVSTDGLNLIL